MPREFARDCQFQKLLAGAKDICLPGLMLEMATDAYPAVDVLGCLAEIERLGAAAARAVKSSLNEQRGLQGSLHEISRLLYEQEGFAGNTEEYYDPRNSYLNEVLRRRTGIPLSLGILYMSVAYRAGIPMYGIATPGHFMIAARHAGRAWYVDPFQAGEVLDLAECRVRVEANLGQDCGDEYFRPATHLEIAVRTLRNLKAAYARADRWPEVLPVQRRLVLMLPDLLDERRDLGLVLLRNGAASQALPLFEEYLSKCGPKEAEVLKPYLSTAKRMAAEMN
ncbi:MAG: SirB1 family protein [Pirellulales bacterium]